MQCVTIHYNHHIHVITTNCSHVLTFSGGTMLHTCHKNWTGKIRWDQVTIRLGQVIIRSHPMDQEIIPHTPEIICQFHSELMFRRIKEQIDIKRRLIYNTLLLFTAKIMNSNDKTCCLEIYCFPAAIGWLLKTGPKTSFNATLLERPAYFNWRSSLNFDR